MFTDTDSVDLIDSLRTNATLVETASLPTDDTTSVEQLHPGMSQPMLEPSPPDRFATIISGRVDKIWRSRQEAYAAFIDSHRSLVLTDSQYANRSLGAQSWDSPSRNADRNLLWWQTGDGWVGTRSLSTSPDQGFAYLTERRATPWNFTFLSSLAEIPPMPVWKK